MDRCAALGALVAGVSTMVASPAGAVDFQREIRPLLAANCLACHGPDDEHREADLRLDQFDGATALAASGARAIVPGKPDQSELVRRIFAADESERMPPVDSGHALTDEQRALVRQWIADGAEYEPHWSLVRPVRPPTPDVASRDWPRTAIDRFLLARLEEAGLPPSPEADRYQLIRRLSLDLRGLPPTPVEVAAFTTDARPDAYDRLVNRFLADPAYGERWARLWLDLARYADSKGLGSDPLREIWLYRDWVIQAFNRNAPFDQFTIEQLAGDLLPEATERQRIATAFHRNSLTNTEGGTDDEEYRIAAVIDRIDTTGQVWLGLTVGCAKCHNHKYDPLAQREYYQLLAFFNQTADNDQPNEQPTIEVALPEISAERAAIDEQVAALNERIASADLAADQTAWEATLAGDSDDAVERRKALEADLLAIVDKPVADRSDDERRKLSEHFRAVAAALEPLRQQIAALQARRPALPTVPVMVELPANERRTTRVLVKANFLSPGDPVEPRSPEALHDWPADAPLDRLGLAQWLVDEQNPLTARVTANRFWAALFGLGIVETEEDFGLQGEPPSHPELLDWLAVEFVERDWDVKAQLRTMVASAAYRQSSHVAPAALERDPRNRLLGRAPRLRLEAEMVRDQALALAGLLCRNLHGPSVFPPQPDGLWQAAFNGERTWATSAGDDRYRRGLYTFWRRTIPYPSMATFDAPSREICTVRRSRTSTPLQAFVTLNDPAYVEAAQALARRIVREGGATERDRVAFGLRLCLARPADEARIAPLVDLFHSEHKFYQGHLDEAQRVAADPLGPLAAGEDSAEMAAWTVVASVLLNLDGVLTK